MPKPFKTVSTRPLPAKAETVIRDGKPHVRLTMNGRTVFYPLSKDGTKYLRKSKSWYFDYRNENGIVRRKKGFADLKATEQLAAEMERRASRIRSGIIDPTEEHARRPLTQHLADYGSYLDAKGNSPRHCQHTLSNIRAMIDGCGFVFSFEADVGKASEWLTSIRRGGSGIALPEGEMFTPREASKILSLTLSGVSAAVRRLQLAGIGNGKARRLPRETVEAIAFNRSKGCGPGTINGYVRAIRGFFRWLLKAKRIGSNPLEGLHLVNAAVDVRRARRELAVDELRRLFDTARSSNLVFRGLTGNDRYHLYLTAAGTGFRANALASLTPNDFDLNEGIVTLPARFNKSRKLKVQPLPADVSDALRVYFVSKPANKPVWGGTWGSNRIGARMLRRDLDAASIPYIVEGPDGPEYADFHSLRHTFLTLGGRSGIDLRTLQELAGHSSPVLTARYSHRRLYDLAGAVAKLPSLVPTEPQSAAHETPIRMTGTDAVAFRGAVPGVVARDIRSHGSASISTFGAQDAETTSYQKPLEKTGNFIVLHRSPSNGTDSAKPMIQSRLGIVDLDVAGSSPVSHPDISRQIDSIPSAEAIPDTTGRSAGRSDMRLDDRFSDPDLQSIASAWPTLPEPIRRAIMAMIEAGRKE